MKSPVIDHLDVIQRMMTRTRSNKLAQSVGLDPASLSMDDRRAIAMVAVRTLDVTDEYFDLVVGANLDWQADQYRYHTGKLHEHSAHEVKKAVIGTVASWQHGPEAFSAAVNS